MSVLIYWLAIRGYAFAVRIASLFNPKAKLFVAGRRGLIAKIRYRLIDERRPRLWMHCASLGEFEQGRPVLESLRKQYPGHAIVLTFFSPSGYEAKKDYEGADYITYLPLDSYYNARAFIDIIKPQLCIFVKYELWYFYLTQISRRDIPLLLISATFRKEQPFFKWYGKLHRNMLQCFSHIFVQDKGSGQLLNRVGVEPVTVAGDTRFDRVAEVINHEREYTEANEFCKGYKIIVAGSTWKADDVFLEKLMQQLPAHWKLVLVPHEVHSARIQEIEKIFEGNVIKWSGWQSGYASARVLLVDRIGLLLQLYRYADVAWVGGGFDKEGVHNVLEAAVYGVPVGFGPVFHKFIEARGLLAEKAAITTGSPATFARQILHWETDIYSYEQICHSAQNYVLAKIGAGRKILDYIHDNNLLN